LQKIYRGKTMASAGLAWSLANGITEAEYYENLRKSLITATENGVSDATIAKEMEKYGISAADLAKATGVATEVVQDRIDTVTTPGLLDTAEDVITPAATSGAKTVTAAGGGGGGGGGGLLTPDAVTPVTPVTTAPVVTAPVVTAPVVTTPAVTAPVVTTPEVKLPTTPITINSPGIVTPATPATPTAPVVTAPATPATPAAPTRSAGLAWSLANGITEAQYYKKVADDYKRAVSQGLTDAQIRSTMDQYGISAADLATATGSDVKKVEERVAAAVPKTPAEIAYDKAAKDELAKRQALADAEKKANDLAWAEQQKKNKIAWEEQQRKNALDYAAQQKALADAERAKLDALRTPATNPFINAGPINPELPPGQVGFTQPTQPETGPLTFEENLKNYQSIPVGAQYNPYAVGGTGSPYSQIMAQAKPLGNPYANALAGQSMGGFNPALYAQAAAAYKAEADAAAAAAAAEALRLSVGGGDANGGDTAGIGSQGGDSAGNTGGGPGTGAPGDTAFAKGGMVRSLLGPDPKGPDDGLGYLDKGEYVIKKSSVNKYGKGLLDMINEGKIPAKKIRSLLD
jgi:antitoxin component HigA of HigAB toxin-antitoxin module